MKRVSALLGAAAFAVLGTAAHAQMGANFFQRPAISSMFRPVVGNGAVYESTDGSNTKRTKEVLVVGKDSADGKEAYWLEFGMASPRGGQGTMYSKVLITKDDFQPRRTIFQMPGQPAMEMPMNPSPAAGQKMTDELGKWAQVGSESIIVPAGSFVCQHWTKNDGTSEVWANETISPFSLVKEVGPDRTEVLVKILTGVQDHITGPVTTFNPQMFRPMPGNPPNQ